MVACTRNGKHPENCGWHPADAVFSVYLPRPFRQSIFLGSDHFYILSPHSAQLLTYFLPIVRFNFGVAFLQLTYRRLCGPCLHRHRPARLVINIRGILGLHSARSGFISRKSTLPNIMSSISDPESSIKPPAQWRSTACVQASGTEKDSASNDEWGWSMNQYDEIRNTTIKRKHPGSPLVGDTLYEAPAPPRPSRIYVEKRQNPLGELQPLRITTGESRAGASTEVRDKERPFNICAEGLTTNETCYHGAEGLREIVSQRLHSGEYHAGAEDSCWWANGLDGSIPGIPDVPEGIARTCARACCNERWTYPCIAGVPYRLSGVAAEQDTTAVHEKVASIARMMMRAQTSDIAPGSYTAPYDLSGSAHTSDSDRAIQSSGPYQLEASYNREYIAHRDLPTEYSPAAPTSHVGVKQLRDSSPGAVSAAALLISLSSLNPYSDNGFQSSAGLSASGTSAQEPSFSDVLFSPGAISAAERLVSLSTIDIDNDTRPESLGSPTSSGTGSLEIHQWGRYTLHMSPGGSWILTKTFLRRPNQSHEDVRPKYITNGWA
jgi:hypothetical protein